MRHWTKAALLGMGLTGALLAAGCAYDDGYYGHRSYYGGTYDSRGYYHHDNYRDRDDRDRDDHSNRVRVCDDDGDRCHWEYQRQ